MEPLSPIIDNTVGALEEESQLSSNLMLSNIGGRS